MSFFEGKIQQTCFYYTIYKQNKKKPTKALKEQFDAF